MAYSRRQVTDHVTKMNKDLYDNVQDGIDECKEDLEVVNTMLGSINEYNPKIKLPTQRVLMSFMEEQCMRV